MHGNPGMDGVNSLRGETMQGKCKECGRETYLDERMGLCYSCLAIEKKRNLIKQNKEALETDELDTWSDEYVICPYCGMPIEPDIDDRDLYQDGDTTHECPYCGKLFKVEVSVKVIWETEKI